MKSTGSGALDQQAPKTSGQLSASQRLDQPPDDPRAIDDTLDRLWRVAAVLPPRELTVVSADQRAAHLRPTVAASEASGAEHDGAAP